MFTTNIQVRFNDVDQMGHINNAIIMEYFDLGKSSFFKAAGIPVTPSEGDFTVMIVHYDVDFLSQVRYTDSVVVSTEITHWGNKSFVLTQKVLVGDVVKVNCQTVMAGYSRSAQTSVPIPAAIREHVEAFCRQV